MTALDLRAIARALGAPAPESTGDFKIKTNRGGASYLDPGEVPPVPQTARVMRRLSASPEAA
jgi:hypothetical protein